MKKIFLVLVLSTLVLPAAVFAQDLPGTCNIDRTITIRGFTCPTGPSVSIETYGQCCAINTVYRVSDIIFAVLFALAAIFFLLGAGTLMMAAGAPERVEKGRNYILYAIIGLAVAFLARAVPTATKFLIGA